jgi:hypothetical protein
MSATITLVDSALLPHRVTAFRESRPDAPDGIVICLGGLRIETTLCEWRPISEALDRSLADLAAARPQPPRVGQKQEQTA